MKPTTKNAETGQRKIRAKLALAGMTQRELAQHLGVADTTLSGWLTGAHAGPPDLRDRIRDALRRRA